MSAIWLDYALENGPENHAQRSVYVVLAYAANDNGAASVSLPTIVRQTHASLSTVRRAVRSMEASGWLSVERGDGENRSQYELKKLRPEDSKHLPPPATVTPPGVMVTPPPPATVTPPGVMVTPPPPATVTPPQGPFLVENAVVSKLLLKANTLKATTTANTPLSPASGGSVSKSKPKPEKPAGPPWSLYAIALKISARAGISGKGNLAAITAQLELEFPAGRIDEADAAAIIERMGAAIQLYRASKDELRIVQSTLNFISSGEWRDANHWPWKQARSSEATVGLWTPKPETPKSEAESAERKFIADALAAQTATPGQKARWVELTVPEALTNLTHGMSADWHRKALAAAKPDEMQRRYRQELELQRHLEAYHDERRKEEG